MDYEFLSKVKAPSTPSPISTSGILETVRETLTDEEWYILRKFAIDGASHLQIAKELGITVSASQKRLERIRKKLENSLPEY
ncbi:MAG: sigma-70 family RNA polymerase sigma factor [Oscillibacter sp.]|nr:sigma-70 family RNA polymerase sigma factor [Oscillibacter sp.]